MLNPSHSGRKALLFLNESLAISAGGPAKVAALVSKFYSSHGHRVSLLSFRSNDNEYTLCPSVRRYYLNKSLFLPIAILLSSIRLSLLFLRQDFVFVSGIWGAFDGFSVRLAVKRDIFLIVRVCGMLEPYILSRNKILKTIAFHLYVKHNLLRADCVIANTPSEKNTILKLVPSAKVAVIPNPVVVPDPFAPLHVDQSFEKVMPKSKTTKTVVYLGRITPKKGLVHLVDAFELVFREYPGAVLLIAGSYSLADQSYFLQVSDKVKSFDCKANVHFLGEVSGDHKLSLLRRADVFVLPSYSEGLSNAVLEALASRTPVVITKECNLPEVESAMAGIISSRDPEQIAMSCLAILKNDSLASSMKENAAILVRNCYSHEVVLRLYGSLVCDQSLFKSLLKNPVRDRVASVKS